MNMRNKVTTLTMAVLLLSTAFATTTHAEWREGDKITFCHVAGLASDPANQVTLTLPYQAVFGQAGHFYENGTPRAGHENDYLGTCLPSDPDPEVCIDYIEAPPGENCNPPETTEPPTTEPPTTEPPVVEPPVVEPPVTEPSVVVGPPPTVPVEYCSTGVINELGGCEPVGTSGDPADVDTVPDLVPVQELPSTGTNGWVLALIGAGLLAAGIALVKASRRDGLDT